MQILKIALVAVALLAVAGQYAQEMRRLAVIRRLSGREARDYYERTRLRSERVMVIVAGALAVIAATSATYVFAGPFWSG